MERENRVETISRLAQWRIDTFGPSSYRRSDSFKIGIWNWFPSQSQSPTTQRSPICPIKSNHPPIRSESVQVPIGGEGSICVREAVPGARAGGQGTAPARPLPSPSLLVRPATPLLRLPWYIYSSTFFFLLATTTIFSFRLWTIPVLVHVLSSLSMPSSDFEHLT